MRVDVSKMKVDVSKIKFDINLCRSCGLKDKAVECGGIYYCPNPICNSAGAFWSRMQWPTYKETDDGRHTVDSMDAINLGRWLLESPHLESLMRYAIETSLTKWVLLELEYRAEGERI